VNPSKVLLPGLQTDPTVSQGVRMSGQLVGTECPVRVGRKLKQLRLALPNVLELLTCLHEASSGPSFFGRVALRGISSCLHDSRIRALDEGHDVLPDCGLNLVRPDSRRRSG